MSRPEGRRRRLPALLWRLALALGALSPAPGARADVETPPVVSGDPDWAAARAAFEQKDWRGLVDRLTRVVARRPWDDDAHNLLGFAYRQLGNYRQALAHYGRALDLNPHHRGALEYLGETYLAMGCVAEARATLARLEAACRRVAAGAPADWQATCEQWRDLREAVEAHGGPGGAAAPGAAAPARTPETECVPDR
jgi:tetratricopeptide (TPR) repeat protein